MNSREFVKKSEGNPEALITLRRAAHFVRTFSEFKIRKAAYDLWWFGLDEAAERLLRENANPHIVIDYTFFEDKDLSNADVDWLSFADQVFKSIIEEQEIS